MDGDVVLLWGTSEGEWMVLPDGDLRAAEEDVLTGSWVAVFLLDLNLDDVAGMFDDFADSGDVLTTDLTHGALSEIDSSTSEPELPENSDAITEWGAVRLDHAESSVEGPEKEENHKQVVSIPESLKVGSSWFLNCRKDHGHERNKHDISSPSWSRNKVGLEPSSEAESLLDGELGKVVPMSDGVKPGEENERPGGELVEGDVLVEWDDTVERSLSGERDQSTADWKEDEGTVDVQDERC